MSESVDRRKVIIDTDPGVDDAMAIAYALCHPRIDLLALTTVFGNCSVADGTRNAQYLLHELGASDVAVARGAGRPLVHALRPHPDFVHGQDGLGNCYPNPPPILNQDHAHAHPDSRDAADLIIDMARNNPGEIDLVAVGPLTNVAQALEREPRLPEWINQLIIMGGTVTEPGNVSPVAEANFLNDPAAADQVLQHDWPATIVGLDVTHRIMLSDTHLAQLRDNAGRTGQLIWETSRVYLDFYSRSRSATQDDEPACAMHDAAALVACVYPEYFDSVQGAARVALDGVAEGQLILDRAGYDYPLEHWRESATSTRACMAVDADAARAEFLNTLIDHHRT